MQHDSVAGPSTDLKFTESLDYEDELDGSSKIVKHLATSNIPNADYQSILMVYKKYMETQKAKIVNEIEEKGNVDSWLDADYNLELKKAQSKIRQEYLMSLGSCVSDRSPTAMYKALNYSSKINIKCMNLLGKGV